MNISTGSFNRFTERAMTDRKITLNLNEHETALLLSVVRSKMEYDDDTWKPFWRTLALTMEDDIEQSLKEKAAAAARSMRLDRL